jgi:hypothetical protein
MESRSSKAESTIGWLLLSGASLLFVPYTVLTIIFDYPNILREDAGVILTRFYDGGSTLVITWWAFAMVGFPLLVGSIQIGKMYEEKVSSIRWATTVGIIGFVVQMIGLLRWTFVVPVLAKQYVSAAESAKPAYMAAFQLIHQFGGVVLGEHIGQIFSIIWSLALTIAFAKLKLMPKWINGLGIFASFIYLLAQTELFAMVIPGFPVIDWAGFLGSTLWLIWLVVMGIVFMNRARAVR